MIEPVERTAQRLRDVGKTLPVGPSDDGADFLAPVFKKDSLGAFFLNSVTSRTGADGA